MNTIATITDIHFGLKSTNNELMMYYFNNQKKFFEEQLFPDISKLGITKVVCLGDFFDTRNALNVFISNQIRNWFIPLLKCYGVHMHLIVGNHDIYYKDDNKINSVSEVFYQCDNVTIYSDPKSIDIDGVNIDLVPWINKTNKDDVLKFIDTTENKTCFGHFELNGFPMYRNVLSDKGTIDTNVLDNYDKVYSGHYHEPSDDGKICYLGSTSEQTWADANCWRGYNLIDLDTNISKQVINKYPVYDVIEYYNDAIIDYKSFENKIVKMIVMEEIDDTTFDVITAKLDKICYKFDIDYNISLETKDEDEIDVSVSETIDILHGYIDQLQDDKICKSTIKSQISSIYSEANSDNV